MATVRKQTDDNGTVESITIIKNDSGPNGPRFEVDNSGAEPELVERDEWVPPYPRSLELSLSSQSIVADGSDTVSVTIGAGAVPQEELGTATLTVAGDSYPVDVSSGSGTQNIQATTTSADAISIEASHPLPNDPRGATATATLEVVQP
ncbi:hypothetical protein [Halolamina sp. C58]|uniref:hypothetical protein n=1 Tax=Halolamina sp. C58 TaxID=3421640 RepID=UPI003EBB66F0